jgi:hypothetical protein
MLVASQQIGSDCRHFVSKSATVGTPDAYYQIDPVSVYIAKLYIIQ